MPTGKDIPLGKLQLDYEQMIKAARAVDGVGASIGKLDQVAARTDKLTTSTSRLTDKLGKLSGFGRDLRQAGSFLGNDTLTAIGGVADGFGDVAQSIDAIVKQKGGLSSVLKLGGAVIGGVVAGTSIYDATIGKMQGTNTGEILDRIAQLIGAGFNPEILKVQAEQVFMQAQKATAFEQFQKQLANPDQSLLDKLGFYTGPKDLEGMKRAREQTQEYLKTAPEYKKPAPGEADVLNYKLIAEVMLRGLDEEIAKQEKTLNDKAQAIKDDATRVKAWSQQINRIGGMAQDARDQAKAFGGLQSASGKFEMSKDAAGLKYRNALAAIDRETVTQRIAIAKQYAVDTAAIDKQYYAQRARLAQSFGVETTRAEEDHQRSIRRLTQDHDKRMSKLADSRDALGLEDEMDAFKTEQQRQDEDYQVAARRRSEDYANQLRELEQAHQEQERERKAQYAQDLIDLKVQAKAKRDAETKEYGLLLADIVKAFVDARNAFAAQMQTTNTTNNNNTANVTQNISGGGVGYTPQLIKQVTYQAISEVFAKAQR